MNLILSSLKKTIPLLSFLNSYQKLKFLIFYLGIFFLVTAPIIAGLLLLISVILGFKDSKDNFFEDKINISLSICSLLMILSCTFIYFSYGNNESLPSLSKWMGIFNWMPLFLSYWGFQNYLLTSNQRKLFSLVLISGTFPVFLSGIGQYFFNWHGPFETLYGLIIWYQRPNILGDFTKSGLTAVFNNPNYAGIWFNLIFAFCLSFFCNEKNKYKKIVSLFFIFLISFCSILTNSRATWILLIIAIGLYFGKKSFKLIFLSLGLLSLIIIASQYPILGNNIQDLLNSIIPPNFLSEFTNPEFARLEIWKIAIQNILLNPFFGTGTASFPYQQYDGNFIFHAHNLPLEFMVSYGVPASIFLFIPILILSYQIYRRVFSKENSSNTPNIDQAWIISFIVFMLSQLVDVTYFDARISILSWLLLAGISNIYKEQKNKFQNKAFE